MRMLSTPPQFISLVSSLQTNMFSLKEKTPTKFLHEQFNLECKTILLTPLFHYCYPNLTLTTPVYFVLLVHSVKCHFRLSLLYSSGGLFNKAGLQWPSWPFEFSKIYTFWLFFFYYCCCCWFFLVVWVCLCVFDRPGRPVKLCINGYKGKQNKCDGL